MNTMQDYEEIIGDHREVEITSARNEGTTRLYKILFGIQLASLAVVVGCAWAVK